MQMMKAVRIHEFGGPETLIYEDAPVPTPETGDVLIKVYAAGVNPVDWKVRYGYLEEAMPHTLPLILGWDVSGVVEAVGEGVTNLKVGDAVYADGDILRDGSYAEYMAVKASVVAPKPKAISHAEAASLPVAALTAWQALFETANLQAGQKALIHAGAGGVGSMAIQLAKGKGAHVITTASASNREYVQSLGADEVIDYTVTPFEQAVKDVDVVFDTIGYETQARSWQTLKPGGFLVSIVTPPDTEIAKQNGVRASYLFTRADRDNLIQIAGLIDSGVLKPQVGDTLPLAEARRAHEQSETRHSRGKIILTVKE